MKTRTTTGSEMLIFFILCITVGCVTLQLHVSRHTWIGMMCTEESRSHRNLCGSRSPTAPCARAGGLSQLLQPVRSGQARPASPDRAGSHPPPCLRQLRDSGWGQRVPAGARRCGKHRAGTRAAQGEHTESPSRCTAASRVRRALPGCGP